MDIYVNGRFRAHKVTGVQRVAHEVGRRLAGEVTICEPKGKPSGWRGHLWEQTALSKKSRDGVLWSPCASGPITHQRHVVTFHDLFVLDSPEWYQAAYAFWYRYSISKLVQTAQHIIAVSEYTKRRLISRFAVDEARISVIHNGVDPSWFSVLPSDIAAARATLQLPSARYLLSVGSLEPRKNLKTLLVAWKDIAAELPADLWLVLAGSHDPNVYRHPDLMPLPPRVHLTGYVPEQQLRGLYAGSLGFVYPSLAEGFGLPPLEAMACGVPVLTSGTTALPEVCGNAVLYFDPTKASELSRSLKFFAGNQHLRQELARLGREQAGRFNWERTAEQTLAVLRAIASPAHFQFCEPPHSRQNTVQRTRTAP